MLNRKNENSLLRSNPIIEKGLKEKDSIKEEFKESIDYEIIKMDSSNISPRND